MWYETQCSAFLHQSAFLLTAVSELSNEVFARIVKYYCLFPPFSSYLPVRAGENKENKEPPSPSHPAL